MSITGTRAGVDIVNTGTTRFCPRCGQPFRRKNQEVCDDCKWLEEALSEHVLAVMANYEANMSDAASAAKIKRSVSFVRRTRARYGLLSARAQQENPDGIPIDYTDPKTGADRFNWITDHPRGWYYRYAFIGDPTGNLTAVRKILTRIADEDVSNLLGNNDRGVGDPTTPAIVLHSSDTKLKERALDEAAVEISENIARVVGTADTVFALFNGKPADKDTARAIIRHTGRGQRVVLVHKNRIVPAAECRNLLASLAKD